MILLAGVLILGGLFAFFVMRGASRMNDLKAQTLANAIPAEAVIEDVKQQGARGEANRRLDVLLTLQVHHPDREPYRATTSWLIEEIAIPRVQPNERVKVRINRTHPDRVYPDVDWAEFNGWTLRSGLQP